MEKSVFGLVNTEDQAERIINKCLQNGFRKDEISVLFSDRQGNAKKQYPTGNGEFTTNGDLKAEGNGQYNNPEREFSKTKKGGLGTEKNTKAPEGGVTGATTGGIIGGTIGLLLGLGTLAIPGLGALVAAGPIVAALSGSAVGGALGLLVGSLVGLGIPEYEAKKYEAGVKGGKLLVCIHASDEKQVEKAKDFFKKEGATDISVSQEKASSAW
ncbi:MAG: hypothetical protein H0X51_01295 [Parachlamydiaceae bacterium]|nr:hypothetical protein [Parachlamydiaceae bacterium]